MDPEGDLSNGVQLKVGGRDLQGKGDFDKDGKPGFAEAETEPLFRFWVFYPFRCLWREIRWAGRFYDVWRRVVLMLYIFWFRVIGLICTGSHSVTYFE